MDLDTVVACLAIVLVGALAGILFMLNEGWHLGPSDDGEGPVGEYPSDPLYVPEEWSRAPQMGPETPPRSDHGRLES